MDASISAAWEYGLKALGNGDVEAGIAVLRNAVAQQSHDAARRRTLRQIERDIRSQGPLDPDAACSALAEAWFAIRQAKHKRAEQLIDWEAVDRAAEQGLAVDPWDVDLQVELGRASEARGHREVAAFAYRSVLEAAPDRADIRERLAALGMSADCDL